MATHLLVTGTVQGVGFREYMRREAQALGVKGWVRNRRDGSVEALVQGEPDAVRKLIEAVKSVDLPVELLGGAQ